MTNAYGKIIDSTHLSTEHALDRGFVHRDYLSHAIRWTFVSNRISKIYKETSILDIGCGVDLPLPKLLYSSRYIVKDYVGLDWNSPAKLSKALDVFKNGKFPIQAFGDVDFANNDHVRIHQAHYEIAEVFCKIPNVITCFEMLEHIEPEHVRRTLLKVHKLMELSGSDSLFYISTPCYDPTVGAAKNHVNEMRREVLGALFEDLGFQIIENYGTFASQRDYKDKFFEDYEGAREIFNGLKGYYDSNYLATIFAPLYPQFSRNNIWVLKVNDDIEYTRKFQPLSQREAFEEPWTSSEKWRDLNG